LAVHHGVSIHQLAVHHALPFTIGLCIHHGFAFTNAVLFQDLLNPAIEAASNVNIIVPFTSPFAFTNGFCAC